MYALRHAVFVCLKAVILSLILAALFWECSRPAEAAQGYNIEKLATAIYWAEGGPKTRHPYGILAKYKTTTPRQACINTIKHALKDWNGEGDFIAFLGRRYCPVGAKNDPTGLNVNWVKNVKILYRKGMIQ